MKSKLVSFFAKRDQHYKSDIKYQIEKKKNHQNYDIMLARRRRIFFRKHENTRKSVEFLTLGKYFWSLIVYACTTVPTICASL